MAHFFRKSLGPKRFGKRTIGQLDLKNQTLRMGSTQGLELGHHGVKISVPFSIRKLLRRLRKLMPRSDCPISALLTEAVTPSAKIGPIFRLLNRTGAVAIAPFAV